MGREPLSPTLEPTMRRLSFLLVFAVLASLTLKAQTTAPADAPYKNPALPVEKRAADLLSRMTLEEKATMLSGSGWMESAPIPRLGIPAIKMSDGPMGVRSWLGSSAMTSAANAPVKIESTSFPSGIAMASTWDSALVEREGQAIGRGRDPLGQAL
jgi:beta-glucosidase